MAGLLLIRYAGARRAASPAEGAGADGVVHGVDGVAYDADGISIVCYLSWHTTLRPWGRMLSAVGWDAAVRVVRWCCRDIGGCRCPCGMDGVWRAAHGMDR